MTKSTSSQATAIQTTCYKGSDRNAIIREHSRIVRGYGVEIEGVTYGRDYFLTKRGATLAAALINDGMPVEQAVSLNCDDIAGDAFRARNRYVDGVKPTEHWLETARKANRVS